MFLNSGMAVLEEHLSVAASVYNPYCFYVMRHITKIALFKITFGSEIYCLVFNLISQGLV